MVMTMTTTPVTSWKIAVHLQNGALAQNVSISDPNVTVALLSNLSPGTFYLIQVAGINTRGIGNFSDMVTAQTYQCM